MKRLFLCVLIIAAFGSGARDAFSCSCLKYYADAIEALEEADFVFVGEVVAVDRVNIPTTVFLEEAGKLIPHTVVKRFGLASFNVLREWKGGLASEYQILAGVPPDETPRDMVIVGGCQVQFEPGKKYLVFARGRFPEADYCMPNSELEAATQSINELDSHFDSERKSRQFDREERGGVSRENSTRFASPRPARTTAVGTLGRSPMAGDKRESARFAFLTFYVSRSPERCIEGPKEGLRPLLASHEGNR